MFPRLGGLPLMFCNKRTDSVPYTRPVTDFRLEIPIGREATDIFVLTEIPATSNTKSEITTPRWHSTSFLYSDSMLTSEG